MQKTRANLTIPRVAASGLTSAQEWLGRQIAWERRLAELEHGDETYLRDVSRRIDHLLLG